VELEDGAPTPVWTEPARAAEALRTAAAAGSPIAQVVWLASTGNDIGAVHALFDAIHAAPEAGYARLALGWTVVTRAGCAVHDAEPMQPAQAALQGFVASMAKEYQHWPVRVADIAAQGAIPWARVLALPAERGGEALAWRRGTWLRPRLVAVAPAAGVASPWRERGVYLVVGGAGGIGAAFCEAMARSHRARIACVGRRAPDAAVDEVLARIRAAGGEASYFACDVADTEALREVLAQVRRQYGSLHGVVHSAVGTLDASIASMDREHFDASLHPNVAGTRSLQQVFAQEALDFVLFFSSVAVFSRDHGKSGYVAGSLYKNAVAREWARGGTTLVRCMDWGWWEVGISAAMPETSRARVRSMGVGALDIGTAMHALEQLLGGSAPELALIRTMSPAARAAILDPTDGHARLYPARVPSLLDALASDGDHVGVHAAAGEPGRPIFGRDAAVLKANGAAHGE
jgi:polyketide synthase PksM